MQYGDVFELLDTGIKSDSNALQTVGIFGKSLCWAVWLHDASKDSPDPAPHLVISPLHPRFWPFLLRFELKLAERVGAMAEAAEFLAKSDLNIQFGESSPSGHHHATWNVVCEAVKVRREFERKIQKLQKERHGNISRARLNRLANELAEAMYRTAVDARDRMMSGCSFLHPRIVKPTFYLLHQPKALVDGAAKELAETDFPAAVRVKWIQNLPVFAFYGTNIGEPFALEYDPGSSMLRSASSGVSFDDIWARGGVTAFPTHAIASIYPEEHHVRVIPIRSAEEMRGLLQIDVQYRARYEIDAGSRAPASDDTSIALWAGVCSQIREYDIDLRRVTNTTTRREANSEGGVLRLIGVSQGELSEERRQGLASRIRELDESPRQGEKGRQLEVTPTISPQAVRKVFISWRAKLDFGLKLRQHAEESARRWGLQPVFVENPEGLDLTEKVTLELAQCDAFFQILAMSLEELESIRNRNGGFAGPPLGWMWYEYGLAKGREIPITRTVDTTSLQVFDWKKVLKVGNEHLGEFKLGGDEGKYIDDSMKSLAHRVREHGRKHR